MRPMPISADGWLVQCSWTWAAILMALGFLHGSPAWAQSRGELLYDMNCIACHNEKMHWRRSKLVNDWAGLEEQVRRWQQAASLEWNDEDVADVARYLNERFYGFAPRNVTGSLKSPVPASSPAGPAQVARPGRP